jgi:uncharacterized protein (TIGR00297 family)
MDFTLAVPAVVGLIAYLTRSLDLLASVAGAVLGYMILFTGGFDWLLVLLAFFVASSAATSFRFSQKEKLGISQKRRTSENVIGNGIVSLFFALQGNVYGFMGALATANSDTFSSEIGVLSREKPVSVLDFRTRLKTGQNGGVSMLGNAAMFAGALVIALLAFPLFGSWKLFWLTLWAGVFGSMIDSVLGATVEGRTIMGNSTVNFLATLSGGLFAAILGGLF